MRRWTTMSEAGVGLAPMDFHGGAICCVGPVITCVTKSVSGWRLVRGLRKLHFRKASTGWVGCRVGSVHGLCVVVVRAPDVWLDVRNNLRLPNSTCVGERRALTFSTLVGMQWCLAYVVRKQPWPWEARCSADIPRSGPEGCGSDWTSRLSPAS